MNYSFRNAALLLIVLALATGLASAQPGLQLSVKSNGTVTQSTYTPGSSGPAAKAPNNPSILTGVSYWDGLAEGDYYYGHFRIAKPDPQIGVGPDDVLTIAGQEIARYPNPITAGGPGGTLNPYNTNPVSGAWPTGSAPTEVAYLDTWLGITNLAALCPSGTGNPAICVIDNATLRYDQMQGRFVVLFTVTDIPAHRSNFVMIVSRFSQFTKCSTPPTPASCPASSPLFTPPVIAPIVGGTQTGGPNAANWYYYSIPVNLTYVTPPTALGTGVVGTATTVTTSNIPNPFVTVNFCPNGGPNLPLTVRPAGTAGSCTNYLPVTARLGFDNDNIIIASTVLDQMGSTPPGAGAVVGSGEGTLQTAAGANAGPYAGTRIVTFPKLVAYNGTGTGAITSAQPPTCVTSASCVAVNLSDDLNTGTYTAGIAFGNAICATMSFVPPAVNNCAPGAIGRNANPLLPIFFEPDNLRGRSLASFDAEVAPANTPSASVITPFDYLVGTTVTNTLEGFNGSAVGAIDPTLFIVQPIVFSCPGTSNGLAGLPWCLAGSSVVAEVPQLGPLQTVSGIDGVRDPDPVGQGYSATQMTTNPANTPLSSTVPNRLFVGDDRPEQVMFREGLLYTARTDTLLSWFHNPLLTSTVLYDVLKTCATTAALPSCAIPSIANNYVIGGNISGLVTTYEANWFNLQSVPDPGGSINGFGFYQPMFDIPADVITVGPASPSAGALPFLEKLFVGMTTGGTANLQLTFSHNFPSLWDFRPGDDAYDTVEPYTDPSTGDIVTTVACSGNVTVTATAQAGNVLTVSSTVGLSIGMYVVTTAASPASQITAIGAGTVTLSVPLSGTFPQSVTFSINPPTVTATATVVTAGSSTITLASVPTTLQIGAGIGSAAVTKSGTTFAAGATTLVVNSTTNVAVGDVVTGGSNSFSVTTIAGVATVSVPNTTMVAVNETVTGTGPFPAGTTVTGIVASTSGNNLVTFSAAATTSGTGSVTVSAAPLISTAPATVVTSVNANGTITVNTATLFASSNCAAAPPAALATCPTPTSPAGAPGVPVVFTSSGFFPGGTTVVNISGTTVTLSAPANATFNAAGNTSSTGVLFTFSAVALTCPMIPFSSRGGAATDPNDGSLWLYGEFAKNRLASIPGPGTWGTSVANYALSFPATDVYGNDNTFYTDVPPSSQFFTWIQIAHNLQIAPQNIFVPAPPNGTCPVSGVTPILQPPAPGSTTSPGTSALVCPAFMPTQLITRSEMARWIVLGQMDEQQISVFLCASGGAVGTPPAGIVDQCTANSTAFSTFADDIGDPNQRYIEVMARRGYTHGCGATNDGSALYCPANNVTRGQMAVFVTRAKMNNVFPSSLSGIQKINQSAIYADNFALFQVAPYFNDCTTSTANSCGGATGFFNYVQLMRELRITNGSSPCTGGFAAPCYNPENNITRQEVATFIVRAFFL